MIEPAAGADRAMLAFLVDAYDEDEIGGEQRTVLRLHPQLAPVKVAVLPLVRKDGQPELAQEIHRDLRERMQTENDACGAIGRRYRRQDEIGTPWAVTVDHQSLEDETVTIRDRDSLEQQRVAIAQLADELERRLRAAVDARRSSVGDLQRRRGAGHGPRVRGRARDHRMTPTPIFGPNENRPRSHADRRRRDPRAPRARRGRRRWSPWPSPGSIVPVTRGG